MHRLECFQPQAVMLTPVREAVDCPRVAFSGIRVADLGGEPLQQPPGAGLAGGREEGRDGERAARTFRSNQRGTCGIRGHTGPWDSEMGIAGSSPSIVIAPSSASWLKCEKH